MVALQAPANIRVLIRVRPEEVNVLRVGTTNKSSKSNSTTSNFVDLKNESDGENKQNGTVIGVKGNHVNVSISGGENSNNANSTQQHQFMFDAVHEGNSTQNEVYDNVKGIVDAVIAGYNGTIVAYGQTGSGKTHTVFGKGVRCDEAELGLAQRSLRDIFQKIQMNGEDVAMMEEGDDEGAKIKSRRTTFKGSFIEIFNERVYDLLAPDSLDKALAVRENTSGVYVEGLRELEAKNLNDVETLLVNGLSNRHVASTNMNRTSSRSHALFVLTVQMEDITRDGLRKVRTSKFTLVDLAGSERQKKSNTFGARLKEASAINLSLSCLGKVIDALVDREHGKANHIPFRDSKLTFLLKDTWGGNSKTCLVATVSPTGQSRSETISTLTFAQRAKLVRNKAVLNEDTSGTIVALQAEVEKLRSKLHEVSSAGSSDCLSQDMSINTDQSESIVALQRRNEISARQIIELEKRASDADSLRNENLSLKRNLQDMERRISDELEGAVRQIIELEKRVSDADSLRNENLRLRKNAEDMESQISDEVESAVRKITELENRVSDADSLRNENLSLKRNLYDMERGVSDEVESAVRQITELENRVSDADSLQDENNSLRECIQDMELRMSYERKNADKRITELEKRVLDDATLQDENLTLKKAMEEIEMRMSHERESAFKRIAELERHLSDDDSLRKENSILKGSLQEMEKRMSDERENAENRIAELEKHVSGDDSLRNEISTLKGNIQEMETRISDENESTEKRSTEFERYVSESVFLQDENSDLKRKLHKIEEGPASNAHTSELKERQLHDDSLLNENLSLKKKFHELEVHLSDERTSKERQIEELERKIEALEKRVSDDASLHDENCTLKRKLAWSITKGRLMETRKNPRTTE